MALPIGWFSTGRDEAALWLLEETLKAISSGFLPIEIAFVFCNREKGDAPQSDTFLDYVAKVGLPLVAFSSRRFLPELWRKGKSGDEETMKEWRRRYHDEVARRLEPFLKKVPFSLLAGYMLIISDEFCDAYTLLNLHPALPGGPKGAWQDVMWELIRQRAEYAGAQIHIVTPELDSGPPVTYCRVSIRTPDMLPLWEGMEQKLKSQTLEAVIAAEGEQEPLFAEIRSRQLAREVPLIHLTLKCFAEGKLSFHGKMVYWEGKPAEGGVDLTEEVEAFLSDRLQKR
ncbi:MAG: formyltransferase family protein [Armatimonadetes bacterium]|nr:formyl transferase [Armatimonadota bacterium]MCX7968252.1 formyltransferase family protein [Armatimonadota bacterium]MDW8143016.1 formyltransferase family protein [Armatimonadota bacterium]